MPLTLHLPPELEAELERRKSTEGFDPEEYLLAILRERFATPTPPTEEVHLLVEITAINQALTPAETRRYRQLQRKRADRTLTPEEQQDLIRFSDRLEEANVQRIERLIRLSRLWNLSLPETMRRAGVKPAVIR